MKYKRNICDACRKIIFNEPQRLINGFTLHASEECFNLYTDKVEQGKLRVPFTLDPRNKQVVNLKNIVR